MSWFTEIAGKAEDLLNKVDQSAATALQNKTSPFRKKSTKLTSGMAEEVRHYDGNAYHSAPESYVSDIQSSFSSGKTKLSQSSLTPMKKAESDDEKLIRFLNCNDTMPPPRKSKPNPDLLTDKIKPPDKAAKEKNEVSQKSEETVIDFDVKVTDPKSTSLQPDVKAIEEASIEKSSQSAFYANGKDVIPSDKDPAEEISMAKKQAEYSNAEMKRMQKKLDHWNSHISENDKIVHELKEKERDLLAALDAKDSQLAVLKIRLQEADQDFKSKTSMINDLKAENERIIKSHADEALFQNRTVETMRDQLAHLESELVKTKEAYRVFQSENMQQRSKFEEEHRHLAENYTSLQKKWSDMNEKNKEVLSQLRNANGNVTSLQQDYDDYKQKAQRILQSKEKLIASLKEGSFDVDQIEQSEASSALLNAEIEGIRQERDLLKEELRQATEMSESYRMENQELEKIAHRDLSVAQNQVQTLKERYEAEKVQKEEFQLLNNQCKEELQFLKEDLLKSKASLSSRIQDREIEIEKLRRQLTAKSLSSVSQNELESRLHALTENLIQKQTVVEALSTEKNSLVLQLERLETQLKESQRFGSQHHTFVGVNNIEPERKSRSLMLENAFDTSISQRVKRVYGSIDALSIRLGVFFRRYPFTRVFVIIYMLLLHLWVMIVLLTYEPEVHNSSYEMIKKKQ